MNRNENQATNAVSSTPLLGCPSCGKEAKVCQWGDTKDPNATWIECECVMMTDTQHAEDPQEAIELAIKVWNGNRPTDLTLIANRVRILAIDCKSRDTFSCEFGNEFAPKVKDYLRECFLMPNDRDETR